MLLEAPSAQLDDLWSQLQQTKSSRLRPPLLKARKTSTLKELLWLNAVAKAWTVDLVRMTYQPVLSQQALDKAFGTALSVHSLPAMEVPLSYGASAKNCTKVIQDRFRQGDTALACLLLSAPQPMIAEAWQFCLEPHPGIGPRLLSECLFHRPDARSQKMLTKALELKDIRMATVLLAYTKPGEETPDERMAACTRVCRVSDLRLKQDFFCLLEQAGWIVNCLALHQELLIHTKLRNVSIVRILVKTGIEINTKSNNALKWAIKHPHLDTLDALRNGRPSSSPTSADLFG